MILDKVIFSIFVTAGTGHIIHCDMVFESDKCQFVSHLILKFTVRVEHRNRGKNAVDAGESKCKMHVVLCRRQLQLINSI
jgi:hypothetical protein